MKGLFILGVLACVMLGATQSSHADPIVLSAFLTGPAEFPPNNSPATGFAVVTFDAAAHTLSIHVTFSGLLPTVPSTGLPSGTTAAHIHSATLQPGVGAAGVATQVPSFIGFPLGVNSGTFDQTFDTSLASFYNPSFVTNNGGTPATAEAALFASLVNGTAYFNIHTTAFPGGEIRGFLTPEPATMLLLGTGLAGVALKFRRRHQAKKSG